MKVSRPAIQTAIAEKLGYAKLSKRTKVAAGSVVLASAMLLPSAQAQVLFSEDFDGLTLGPFVSSTEIEGDGSDWTTDAPAGWTKDNAETPSEGPAEFFGWTFMEKDAWIATAGNQSRDSFAKGSGIVAVADPDEYDDSGDIDPGLMNVFLMTPEISLAGQAENSVQLSFDSSFRPYPTMVGTVDVSFDGGSNWDNLLTLNDATVEGGTSSLERANSLEILPLSNPADASAMVRFALTDAGNDWWWAIDNVEVSVVPEPTSGILGLCAAAFGLMFGRKKRS